MIGARANGNLRPLRGYQIKAFNFVRGRNYQAILGLDVGTGKTITTIRLARSFAPNLIICRRDDFLTWQLELEAEGLPTPGKIDSGNALQLQEPPGAWTLVTYDLVTNSDVFAWIKRQDFQFCIADECQQIARWDAARTKAVIRATQHIPRRIALSATVIGNDAKDVFSIALFVDGGRTFGDKEWSFLKRYYLTDPMGHGYYLRRGAKDEIAAKYANIAYSVKADDVLDLPPFVDKIVPAQLSESQLIAYESCLREWEYTLATGDTIEIDQVIVQLQKLRQISSGFIYYNESDCPNCGFQPSIRQEDKTYMCGKCWEKVGLPEQKTQWLDDPGKLSALHSLIAELEDPKIVIWCAHTAEIHRIASELSNALTFTGSMSRSKRESSRLQFKSDPRYRFFVGQEDAGVGMNELVVARTAIYYAHSFKARSLVQSRGRTRRIGSEIHDRIYYYDLTTENTVDVKIRKGLTAAIGLAQYIYAGLKKGKPIRKLLETY